MDTFSQAKNSGSKTAKQAPITKQEKAGKPTEIPQKNGTIEKSDVLPNTLTKDTGQHK